MEVSATGKFLQMSPRKARIIFQDLRGMTIDEALTTLRFTPKPGAKQIAKLVQSAAANAENNYAVDPDELHIKSIYAGDARTLKRFRAAARGRIQQRLKRTCHVTVVVSDEKD